MADGTREDCGLESQSSSVEGMPSSQHCPSGDSLPEWRSSEQVENGTPSTSPPYWDTDDDDDDDDDPGPRPSDLFGKYTWKIDDFSQINKRELRSNIFEIGGYKWYILIYPQGCDVCNHLSLFLCVANHDKLLPGWSHFAQFTIAVVNKDSKKSKYSDTLHRFWKKEHDWGWKKFMELSKVSDGFLVEDALVIKAQVQVIREKTHRPFRCLDWQYRRELVRVYLSNVEQLCRRFVEEKRGKFSKMLDDKVRWSSFHAFWLGVDQNARRRMSREKSETILKVVVKHFFIENEVTSTLVMDYLYSGLKALECQSKSKKGRAKLLDMEELPAPFVRVEKDVFVLTDDVLLLLQRAALEPLPPKDEKGTQNQNRMKEGNCGDELSKDAIERDERRLTELGRRTVEIFALNHIFCRIEVAYQEAVALRRQEELIREEEAAGQAENEMKSKRSAAEKEKRTKKKQTKQKKGSRKGKVRVRDEKHDTTAQKVQVENITREVLEFTENQDLPVLVKAKTLADISDMSDVGDDVAETLQLDLEDRDTSPISWDTDTSEIHPPVAARNTEMQMEQADKKTLFVMDDSSSTCSTDSIPSVVMNGTSKGTASSNSKNSSSHSRGRNQRKSTSNQNDPAHSDTDKLQADSTIDDTTRLCDVTGSCRGTAPEFEAVGSPLNEQMQQLEQHLVKEEAGSLQKKPGNNDQVAVDGPFMSVNAEPSSPASSINSLAVCQQSKQTSERGIIAANPVTIRESSSNIKCLTEKLVPTVSRSPLTSKREAKSSVDARISMARQVSIESRPSSAPIVPALRPTTPLISKASAVPLLSRSVSAAGRLGIDPSPPTQSQIVQSYRNAIVTGKTTVGVDTPNLAPHPTSCSSSQTPAFSRYSSSSVSSGSAFLLQKKSTITEKSSGRMGLTFGSVNPEALQSQCLWTEEPSQVEAISSVVNNQNLVRDTVGPYFGGSCPRTYRLDEVSSGLSGQTQGLGVSQDEFPHLDIINDLLDEEQSGGEAAVNGYFNQPPHTLNQQYTFTDDASTVDVMSNSSGHFDQLDQYYEDQIQRVYGCSSGPLDGRRGLTSTHVGLSAYANGQVGGVIQNQWPLGIAEHSVLAMGSTEPNGYAYHLPDYSNLSCGLNGYNMYRPANGH